MSTSGTIKLRFSRLLYVGFTVFAAAVGFVQVSSRPAQAQTNQAGGKGQLVGGYYVCDCTNGGSQCKCLT
jgi:hypothetical protein